MKNGAGILLIFSILLLLPGCSTTRRLAEGEYLLVGNRVTVSGDRELPRGERVTPSELAAYIRQRPNKRLFGVPFFLQIHNLSAPERENWTKRIGEPPVVYDSVQTALSAAALSTWMRGHGFFHSTIAARVDTLPRRRVRVAYDARSGAPWRIGTLAYDFRDTLVAPLVRADSAVAVIRSGDIFDTDRMQDERRRISDRLKNQGFFDFSINAITLLADTVTTPGVVNLVVRIRQQTSGVVDSAGRAVLENSRVYRLRHIYIQPGYDAARTVGRSDTIEQGGVRFIFRRRMNGRPDMNVHPEVLLRAVSLRPGERYDASAVNRSYDNLMRLNYFRSANVVFSELPDTLSSGERLLDCTILCTPGTRQSYNVDLEATTAATYYGLLTTLGYQNRNLLRGAEAIDLSTTFGYEFMRAEGRKNSIELGGSAGVTFPRFVAPWRIDLKNRLQNVRTRAEVSVNYQNRPFYRRTLSSANWGYSWRNRRNSTFTLRPVDVSVINANDVDPEFLSGLRNRYLQESFKSQLLLGVSGSYVFNNQTQSLDANSFRLRLSGETYGNLLNAAAPLFARRGEGEDYYTVLGIRYAQYVRGDLDMSYKFVTGPKTALAARFYVGAGHTYGNSRHTSIPFERLFYAGGPNSMRGWQVRMLGPGSAGRERTDGTQAITYPAYVANFKLETNLEFRFPVYRFLNGALFTDLGNIWQTGARAEGDDPDAYFRFDRFYDQLGLASGLGARLDFNFFLFRVDWGVRIHDPNQPRGQKWIRNLTLGQSAFNFSVGYPF